MSKINTFTNEQLISLVREMIDEETKQLNERIEELEVKFSLKNLISKLTDSSERSAREILKSLSIDVYSDADGKSPRELGDILDELTNHWKSLNK